MRSGWAYVLLVALRWGGEEPLVALGRMPVRLSRRRGSGTLPR